MNKPREWKLAQIQMPVLENPADSFQLAARLAQQAVESGADLIALPEMFACPYDTKNFPVYAEPEGGPLMNACSELAAKLGVYLSAGTMPERDVQGRVYNTAYVFDRAGHKIAKHRKAHLFDIDIKGGQYFKESDTLTAGDTFTVFETEFGCFGLCICYDFRFPELVRSMALARAECILVPAAFNLTTGPAHWELMFRSQSMYNQVFACGTAPARQNTGGYVSWGHSIVTDPWGSVITELDETEGIGLTCINLERVAEVRAQLPLLRQRRPDIYTIK